MDMNQCLSVLSMLIAVGSFILAGVAFYISKKSVLIEKRFDVFDKMENFIKNTMRENEDKNYYAPTPAYSNAYLNTLFSQDILEYIDELKSKSEAFNILLGDYNHALEHGECRDRGCSTIAAEISDANKYFQKQLNGELYEKFKKYLKV